MTSPTPTPLWQKDDTRIDHEAMAFMAGRDVLLDVELLPFDIRTTGAHVDALGRAGCLDPAQHHALRAALERLAAAVEAGQFIIDAAHEDGHSAIEAWLVEELGELGKRVHLGRSRNDQVLVATRLLTLDALGHIETSVADAAGAALHVARERHADPMPGYTHLQRAVPSSVGLWMASFAEAFIDDLALLRQTRQWLSASPLGTAAGYGVNIPLDRAGVATALGFERVQINPMYAQASRGKFEIQALTACWQVMQDVRRLAWDFSLFTTAEFGFVAPPAGMTTGSSIMPNKRNPDVIELLRASAAVLQGALAELQGLLSLPGGYHRDLQLSKEPLLRGLRTTRQAMALVPRLLSESDYLTERMGGAIDEAMLATDQAVDLARSGVPFRDAYRQVARSHGDRADVASGEAVRASLEARTSPGACADLMLNELDTRLQKLRTLRD